MLLLLLLLVLKPSDDAIDKYLIKKLKLGDDFRTQTKNIPDKHRSIEASQSFNPIEILQVKWADTYDGYGEHAWDYNHGYNYKGNYQYLI